jgi:hypothetical protein
MLQKVSGTFEILKSFLGKIEVVGKFLALLTHTIVGHKVLSRKTKN